MTNESTLNSVPTFDALFNPTLDAIRDLGGSASIAEIANRVIENLRLPTEVIQVPHGRGRQTEVEYRLAWSRTYLKKYGLIDNSERGVWSLTALGLGTKSINPREVVSIVVATDRLERQDSSEMEVVSDDAPELIEDSSSETASWRESLMETLLGMSPDAFERLCQRLLRESGFIEVKVTGKPGDGGIDGHGIIRLAGLIGFPVMFQCKRYSSNVGASVVRDFRGAMIGRADKGLILTTGGFTREAHAEATREGAPPIDLIDGDFLLDKLKELRLGIGTKTVEVVEVDHDWFVSL
jgi:restriction system protein